MCSVWLVFLPYELHAVCSFECFSYVLFHHSHFYLLNFLAFFLFFLVFFVFVFFSSFLLVGILYRCNTKNNVIVIQKKSFGKRWTANGLTCTLTNQFCLFVCFLFVISSILLFASHVIVCRCAWAMPFSTFYPHHRQRYMQKMKLARNESQKKKKNRREEPSNWNFVKLNIW